MTYIIKHLMHTWFEETEPLAPGQPVGLVERISRLGEEVDFTNPNAEKRALDLNAVYTDEEAEMIREGTYRGIDAENVYSARRRLGFDAPAETVAPQIAEIMQQAATGQPQADAETATAGGIAFASASEELLGFYIRDYKLSGPATLDLLPADPTTEDVEKLMDAENLATNNSPRGNVIGPLEKKLTDISTTPPEEATG